MSNAKKKWSVECVFSYYVYVPRFAPLRMERICTLSVIIDFFTDAWEIFTKGEIGYNIVSIHNHPNLITQKHDRS